jgi:hypothetical protein
MIQDESLVLVCIFPELRDAEIARLFGWYRIPLRNSPKVVSVDALAFYQPKNFGKNGGRIMHYAKVRGHELTTRKELLRDEPEHPHANEEYFKIQIGELESLPAPIVSGPWKRFSFFYTTGEHLKSAQNLSDLIIRNEERLILWKTLRERAAKDQVYQVNLPELPISNDMLLKILGLSNL